MKCSECKVTDRCVNDGDRTGAAKYLPCRRDSFYDPNHNFCDRDNSRVVADECYFCRKCVCKNTDVCGNSRKDGI